MNLASLNAFAYHDPENHSYEIIDDKDHEDLEQEKEDRYNNYNYDEISDDLEKNDDDHEEEPYDSED